MIKINFAAALLLPMALWLGACSSSAPLQQQYFVLSATPLANVTMVSGEPKVSIRRVKLPDYLNQRGIARQIGGDKIRVSNNLLWAEKLSKSLPTVLASNIAVKLKQPIEVHPLPPGIEVKTIVEVDIERFIADDSALTLLASYRLVKPKQLQSHRYHTEIALSDNSVEALVSGYQQAAIALANDIAEHL